MDMNLNELQSNDVYYTREDDIHKIVINKEITFDFPKGKDISPFVASILRDQSDRMIILARRLEGKGV